MKEYNMARYALAFAYLFIGGFNGYKIFISAIHDMDLNLIRTFTLGSSSYQAFLFTFALLILIQPGYISIRRIFLHFGIITLIFVALVAFFYSVSSSPYEYGYNIASLIYVFQLIYYVFLFRNKYARCLKQLAAYYNEDEDNRLRWVKLYFYMALSIGIITLCMTYLPLHYYVYIIPFILLFYIFFAIKYYNYPVDFRYLICAVYADDMVSSTLEAESDINENESDLPLTEKEEKLLQSLNQWVEKKQYLYADVSRDEIAGSLGTDRYFLSHFFHSRMKIEFRIWRTRLRIDEAKELLLQYPELSISKIADKAGIPDRSNFQKKFKELVGVSPKEWRKQQGKNVV